jgi:hypothetical protein
MEPNMNSEMAMENCEDSTRSNFEGRKSHQNSNMVKREKHEPV